MKIKITERITEIEASAAELSQSNSLSDGFRNLLRHILAWMPLPTPYKGGDDE